MESEREYPLTEAPTSAKPLEYQVEVEDDDDDDERRKQQVIVNPPADEIAEDQGAKPVEPSQQPHQSQQPASSQQRARLSPSIRSQSSPSSLTTHKFGLRLTPSPPRLMIDHETGDIIETYPEQPTYLRTFQPVLGQEQQSPARPPVAGGPSVDESTTINVPEEEEDDDDDTAPNTNATFDDSLAHPCPPPLTSQRQVDHYNQLLLSQQQQQQQQQQQPVEMPANSQHHHHHPHHQHHHHPNHSSNSQSGNPLRPMIPPPHQNKQVYFGPAEQVGVLPSNFGFPLHQTQQQQANAGASRLKDAQRPTIMPIEAHVVGERQFTLDDLAPHLQQTQRQTQPLKSTPVVVPSTSGGAEYANKTSIFQAHDESLRRALDKLEEGDPTAKTDLIIVIEPEEEKAKKGIKVTRTNAEKASILINAAKQYKAQQQQQQQQQQAATGQRAQPAGSQSQVQNQSGARPTARQSISTQRGAQATQPKHQANASLAANANTTKLRATKTDKLTGRPDIRAFHLYGWLYTFMILLALSLSSLIIYLLVVPLQFNCTLFRPSYTHISIILASCNLIFICIFSLFWYCTGVTRTFYANLSSSAFIITTYSILVCLNLSLGILFFIVNTCQLQKTTTPLAAAASADGLYSEKNNSYLISYDASGGILIERLLALTTTTISPEDVGLSMRNRRSKSESLLLERLSLKPQKSLAHSNSQQPAKRLSDDDDGNDNESGSDEPPEGDGGDDSTTDSNGDEITSDQNGSRDSEEMMELPNQPTRGPKMRHPPVDGGGLRASPTPASSGGGGRRRIIIDGYQTSDHRYSSSSSSAAATATYSTTSSPIVPMLNGNGGQGHHYPQPPVGFPTKSPWEAAWEYTKERWAEFKVKFFKFITRYDLRFIGALHALCAICLQYLAIKVASVRSHYCSPRGGYCI